MPDGLGSAQHLHARALEAQILGHPRTALRLLTKARVELEKHTSPEAEALLAAVWISIALNETELNGLERGSKALAEARRRAYRVSDPGLVVRVHNQSGLIASRTGRLDAALADFSAALGLIEHANDHDRFAILLNVGTLRLIRGDLAAAARHLRAAAEFAHGREMPFGELKALHNLGYLEFLRGDLPRALELIEQASRIDVPISRGVLLLDRSRVLIEAGLIREADLTLVEAEEIFRKERLAQDLGEVELERARVALLAGDVPAARRLAGRARDRFRRRGNDHSRRAAELVLLQGDLAAARPGARLEGPAQRLRAEFEAAGLRLPAVTASLIAAEAQLSSGRTAAAAATLAAMPKLGLRDPITARLHHAQVRAQADLARGRRSSAARRARSALAELARYQASFGSIDLSTAAAVHGRRLAELDVATALVGGVPSAVFDAAEYARAVAHRLPAVRPPDDPRAAELLAELRQTVESLRAAERDPTAAGPLVRRRQELQRQIALLSWSRSGSGQARAPATVEQVRARLRDATLVMLLQSGSVLYGLVVDANRLELRTLVTPAAAVEQVRRIRADLDVLAQPQLPIPLRSSVARSLRRSLATLDDHMIRPFDVGDRPVVVVSTGLLGQLPWGMLPSLAGVPVVVTPSASAWYRASERRRGGRRPVVALAGPDLERAGDELKGVGDAWSAVRSVSDTAADRHALTAALAKAGVVHVAAHGVHNTENPLFSSLRLADGDVFAHELDRTKRTAEHVILSACELGLATVRPGDEALGLTSVLLHLGTRSVVAGVARVGDGVAAETMTAYHRELARGSDSASALATALAANDPDRPAPFVCFGAAWSAAAPAATSSSSVTASFVAASSVAASSA